MSIKRPQNFFGEEIPLTVFIAKEQLQSKTSGLLFGRYFEDTGIFNIYPPELSERGEVLGEIFPMGHEPLPEGLCGISDEEGIDFYWDGEKIRTESYELYQKIFSRNQGILESDVMSKKCAVILGCGSVGSLVALELAKTGVGHFVLVDGDTLEYHNLCRHQCSIEDVGDLKVNALKRKLLGINPKLDVKIFGGIVQNIPKELLDSMCEKYDTIFIGCADNRIADVYSNRIANFYDAAFLSIGFWERAYAGEIFYHLPHEKMACYSCALGDGGEVSARVEANHHVYSSLEHLEEVKFEPGISVDINFITAIGIKLIIDIFNRTNSDYIPRLLSTLKQYTLICNTSNPEIGGEMVDIFSYPLQVTTSLVVGNNGRCRIDCPNQFNEE